MQAQTMWYDTFCQGYQQKIQNPKVVRELQVKSILKGIYEITRTYGEDGGQKAAKKDISHSQDKGTRKAD